VDREQETLESHLIRTQIQNSSQSEHNSLEACSTNRDACDDDEGKRTILGRNTSSTTAIQQPTSDLVFATVFIDTHLHTYAKFSWTGKHPPLSPTDLLLNLVPTCPGPYAFLVSPSTSKLNSTRPYAGNSLSLGSPFGEGWRRVRPGKPTAEYPNR
jgi:hypothetical protein